MKIIDTSLKDLLIIAPEIFEDNRGFFMESFHKKKYADGGIFNDFVQDNMSCSVQGTLRGLHYQLPHLQAKIVQVLEGSVIDVCVDIRVGSPTFGKWFKIELSNKNKKQIYIPRGFAHGFCVLSKYAIMMYKCDAFYYPEYDRGILWSDPDLGIEWPVDNPILSDKDMKYSCLKDLNPDELPLYEE